MPIRLRVLVAASATMLCLTACETQTADTRPAGPPAVNSEDSEWCYAVDWIESASNTYYMYYGFTRQDAETIRESTVYGGALMYRWHQMRGSELPVNVTDEELRAWALRLQAERERGSNVQQTTDAVLDTCLS